MVRQLAMALCIVTCLGTQSYATLKLYYDPLTGNVSLDTTETRSGAIYGYGLNLKISTLSSMQFRYENLVSLSNSTYISSTPSHVGQSLMVPPAAGLLTLGDILPANLTQGFWQSEFAGFFTTTGSHNYVDIIGGGEPSPAVFLYGRPEGEFDNRVDLLDPDTLTWAQQASLLYNPGTGEVSLDTAGVDGGYTTGIYLKSDGTFLPEGFDPEFDGNELTTADAGTVFSVAELIEAGRYSLGEILPPSLSRAEFEGAFTTAHFYSRAGFGGGPFDFLTEGEALNLVFIPEPSAFALIAAAVVGTHLKSRSRRRRANL